MKWKFKKSCT